MKQTSEIIANAAKENRKHLLETEAKTICMEYGIPVTRFKLAKNEEEAVKFAEEIGFPVVLKVVSPDIIHKSDIGGVILNIKNAKEVKAAYKQIMKNAKKHVRDAKILGVIVQEMAHHQRRLLLAP